jgi:hypothetical protein
MITTQLINTAPWFEIIHPVIYKNDSFDYKSYIKAFDKEEGDISKNIKVLSNPYINQTGVYSLTFEVADKYGYKTTGIMTVTVLEPLNTPPTITASNKSVNQFTQFDPYKEVYAFDLEDGNITDQMSASGDVDTTRIGENIVCYHVTDSHGASSSKCIIVTVMRNLNSVTRFISNNAKNTAKFPWQYFNNVLDRELLNKEPILSKTIRY